MALVPVSAAKRGRPPAGALRSMERGELAVVFKDLPSYSPYIPRSGPPLKPITLIPPRDSTAYIADEEFVAHTESRERNKRVRYYVRWADLPAASVLVDAGEIRKYVSAKAYEDWYVKLADEKEEEETRQAILAVRQAEEQEHLREGLETGIVLRNGTFRSDQLDQPAKRATTPQHGEKRHRGRPRKSQPSLSTPRKVRLEHFEDFETDVDTSDEQAILRQLNADVMDTDTYLWEGKAKYHERDSGHLTLELPRKKQRTVSVSPTRNGAPGSRTSTLARSIKSQTKSRAPAKQQTSKVPSKSQLIETQRRANQSSASPNPGPSSPNKSPAIDKSHSAAPQTAFTPLPQNGDKRSSMTSGKTVTPIPIPGYAHKLFAIKATAHSTPKPKPKATPKPKARLQEPKAKSLQEEDADQVYVVKRLEDAKIWEEDGKVIRHFKVRWEGNWPKDQNPTWEPEENLPKDLVRKFLLRRPIGFDGAADKIDDQPVSPWPTRKYSSVSEAFQGEVGDDMMEVDTENKAESAHDEDETLLVTNEPLSSHPFSPVLDIALGRAY